METETVTLNKKTLIKYYIATGAVALVPTIYFLVRIIVDASTSAYLSQTWKVLNFIAIGFYGVALLMLVAVILYSYILEKRAPKKELKAEEEREKLLKYKTK